MSLLTALSQSLPNYSLLQAEAGNVGAAAVQIFTITLVSLNPATPFIKITPISPLEWAIGILP